MNNSSPIQKSAWSVPVGLFLVSRLFIITVIQIGLFLFPSVHDSRVIDPFPHKLFLNGLVKWDGGWYGSIAEDGYSRMSPYKTQANLAFMPFYPLLIKLASLFIPHTFLAGIVVSHIALFLALYWLYEVLRNHYGPTLTTKGLLLMLFSPFSFYFSTMYPESIFLATISGMFFFALKKRWFLAALCSLGAGITREMGIMVFLVLCYLYLSSINFKLAKLKIFPVLKISAGIWGLFGYLLYLYLFFGDPLIFIKSHLSPGWLPQFGIIFFSESIKTLAGQPSTLSLPTALTYLIHPLMGLIFLVMLILGRRQLEKPHFLWAFFTILMMFANWRIMGRLLIIVFPVFIVMAYNLKRILWYRLFFFLCILLLVFLSLMFSHGYWVA